MLFAHQQGIFWLAHPGWFGYRVCIVHVSYHDCYPSGRPLSFCSQSLPAARCQWILDRSLSVGIVIVSEEEANPAEAVPLELTTLTDIDQVANVSTGGRVHSQHRCHKY